MKVICKASSKGHTIAKNGILQVVEYRAEDSSVCLKDIMVKPYKNEWIQTDIFVKSFQPAYFITADKSQGQTFTGKVFIHQLDKIMPNYKDYNRGYVALGRATNIENLFLADI